MAGRRLGDKPFSELMLTQFPVPMLYYIFCEVYITRIGVRGYFVLWVFRRNQWKKSNLHYSEETKNTVRARVSAITIVVDKYTQMMRTHEVNQSIQYRQTLYKKWKTYEKRSRIVGYKTKFFRSVIFLIFQNYQNIDYLHDITGVTAVELPRNLVNINVIKRISTILLLNLNFL